MQGTGLAAQILFEKAGAAVLALHGLDVAEVHERLRTLHELPHLRLAGGRFPLVRMVVADRHDVDERGPHPGDAGTRQNGIPVWQALAEGEDVEAVGPRAQGVRLRLGEVDQAIALAHLVGDAAAAVVLPGDARAAEDEEDLLLGAFDVSRRRPLAGVDPDTLQPGADRAGRSSEVEPGAGDVTGLAAAALDVVPVREVLHGAYDTEP